MSAALTDTGKSLKETANRLEARTRARFDFSAGWTRFF